MNDNINDASEASCGAVIRADRATTASLRRAFVRLCASGRGGLAAVRRAIATRSGALLIGRASVQRERQQQGSNNRAHGLTSSSGRNFSTDRQLAHHGRPTTQTVGVPMFLIGSCWPFPDAGERRASFA